MKMLDAIMLLAQAADICCGSVNKIILDENAFIEAIAIEQYCTPRKPNEPHKIAGIIIELEGES